MGSTKEHRKNSKVTVQAPKHTNDSVRLASAKETSRKKAKSAAPVSLSITNAHSMPPKPIIENPSRTAPETKSMRMASETLDQDNSLPHRKHRPKYPPELKSFYKKAKAEISSKGAEKVAAKAKKGLNRLEAIKEFQGWSASFVIPSKTDGASPPGQSKSPRPLITVPGNRAKPAEAIYLAEAPRCKEAAKPAKASKALKAEQKENKPSPVGAKKKKGIKS